MLRTYTVYKGEVNGMLVYIGTTIQKPEDRFRWHKHNGKPFHFTVIEQFDNKDDMLNLEFELIKKHKPKHNKIRHRKQNLNVKLTQDELDGRKGDKAWCQCCLKRRVNTGYQNCFYCGRGRVMDINEDYKITKAKSCYHCKPLVKENEELKQRLAEVEEAIANHCEDACISVKGKEQQVQWFIETNKW